MIDVAILEQQFADAISGAGWLAPAAAFGGGLLTALNPRLTRRSAMVDQERIRTELDKGLRALEEMGFLDRRGDEELRLRSPLLRFADPVRTLADPAGALSEMMARGEIDMEVGEEEEEDE